MVLKGLLIRARGWTPCDGFQTETMNQTEFSGLFLRPLIEYRPPVDSDEKYH